MLSTCLQFEKHCCGKFNKSYTLNYSNKRVLGEIALTSKKLSKVLCLAYTYMSGIFSKCAKSSSINIDFNCMRTTKHNVIWVVYHILSGCVQWC